MIVDEIKAKESNKRRFGNLYRRTKFNSTLAVFYERLAEDNEKVYYDSFGEHVEKYEPDRRYMNTAKNLRFCGRVVKVDHYRLQGIKDILEIRLCHNRFCDNCQSAMAYQRFLRFSPVLDELARVYDLYHVIFTVPNPLKVDLKKCIDLIYNKFRHLIRIFTGDVKIKGFSFEPFGFFGGIRALEITTSDDGRSFHPHLHCIFALKKGLQLDENRKNVNTYSFSNEHIKRIHKKHKPGEPFDYFSDFEILLQKIWRLLIDGEKITLDNISRLPLGYSVKCRNANGAYKEVFKYATKGLFSQPKENAVVDGDAFDMAVIAELTEREQEKDFRILEAALKGRKVVQGYGALYHLKLDGEIDQSANGDEDYKKMVAELRNLETPEQFVEYFNDFKAVYEKAKGENVVYTSRNSISTVFGEDKWALEVE